MLARPVSRLGFMLLCVVVCSVAGAAEPDRERSLLDDWRWAHFTVDTGLPSNDVHRVVETRAGTVYAATEAGLAWYDGYRWSALGPEQGLPAGAPSSLEADWNGDRVLVVTDGRLYQGDRRGFRPMDLAVDGEPLALSHAFRRPDGTLILGQAGRELARLWVVRGETLTPLDPPAALKTNVDSQSFWMGRDGTLWANTVEGLCSWDDDGWRKRLSHTSLYVWSVAQGENGHGVAYVDLPASMRGLWTWQGKGPLTRALAPEGAQIARALDVGPNGDVIVVYTSGHVRLRQSGVWRALAAPPPQLVGVEHVCLRGDDGLWAATGHGLYAHASASKLWTVWRTEGLDNRNQVHEIVEAKDGTVWIATGRGVEHRRADGSLIRHVGRIGEQELDIVTALAEDGRGHIWIGSGATFSGAFRWDGKQWTHFGPAEGLLAPAIHKIRVDRWGRPWFLALGPPFETAAMDGPGAFLLDGDRFERWTIDRPRGTRVYDFVEGTDGAYWFGTWTGLSRHKGGRWTHWPMEELGDSRVFTLAAEPDGRIWFGNNRSRHLGYVSGSRVVLFGPADGFVADGVWDLRLDTQGRLWIATSSGVVLHNRGVFASFRQEDGLVNLRVWPILPSTDRVYIGTLGSGTAVLDLAELRRAEPRVELLPAIVGDGGEVTLRWNALSRDGTPPSGSIETRHRLNGADWSAWGRSRQIVVHDLAAGAHTLEVQAKGYLADPGPVGEPLVFSIPRPLAFRPEFFIPIGLLSLVTIGLAVSYATRRMRHESEKKRLELQLRQSQKMEALGRLAGGVAHDFNNLLQVIGGYAQVLQRPGAGEKTLAAARQIEKSAERAAALTRQLLAFSRRQVLRPQLLNPNATLVEMQPMLDRLIGEDVELVAKLDPSVGRIRADPGQIEQMLLNLVVNARDAMPRGGRLTIETNAVSVGGPNSDRVRLTVQDTGCGMSDETRARAFEPFFTTKERGKGTGLGLSTVYGIVTQSGGQIGIDSTPGVGTQFVIDLPCVERTETSVSDEPISLETGKGSEVVLVVEDEAQVRGFAREALESEGYTVVVAANGEEAIRLCDERSGPIHLLLTDVVMPRMNGPQVARELRRRCPSIRVLFMSGYAPERLLDELAGDPSPRLLEKPFTIKQLRRRVREVLDDA